MRIAVAADHAGFELKQELADELRKGHHEIVDLGAHHYDKDDDYPDFAAAIGRAVQSSDVERGVLICGSGVGASIAANKLAGVRAGLCHDTYSAHQGVEHDDMNLLVLGSRIIGVELARDLVKAFIHARFSGDERHKRRLEKVRALETNPTA
jgi:ribose 5-phosphate isomerase B